MRTHPVTGKQQKHEGIDISCPVGTSVRSTGGGKVTFAGTKGKSGKTVIIDHGNGVKSAYAHLNDSLVKPGDVVKKGQVIGKSGNTGRSTGPHLHYGERVNGKSRNPTFNPARR